MQRLQGQMRKAITEYQMIENGDRIAVGVSGGKDSLALLYGLAQLKKYMELTFSLHAITLDMGFEGKEGDFSAIEALCAELDVPYTVKRTQIGEIVFDIRKEPNPCSLCARMRRGSLHDEAKLQGCNKIALGHHMDDAVETFFLNLFYEGRIGCFSPKSFLSRKELWMIRPMVFATEHEVIKAARETALPVMASKCPADGHSTREEIKKFIAEKERLDHGFRDRIFGAMIRSGIDGW